MLARLLRALIRHDTRPDAARSEPDTARRQLAEGDQLQRMRRFAHVITSYSIHYTKLYEPKNASLERCDLGKGPGVVKGAYAALPRYFADANQVMDAESRILYCMRNNFV